MNIVVAVAAVAGLAGTVVLYFAPPALAPIERLDDSIGLEDKNEVSPGLMVAEWRTKRAAHELKRQRMRRIGWGLVCTAFLLQLLDALSHS